MFREGRAIFDQANKCLSPDLYTKTGIKVCMKLRKNKYSIQLWGLGAWINCGRLYSLFWLTGPHSECHCFLCKTNTRVAKWGKTAKTRVTYIIYTYKCAFMTVWRVTSNTEYPRVPSSFYASSACLGWSRDQGHAVLNKVYRNENGRPCKLPSGALETRFSSVWMDGALLT